MMIRLQTAIAVIVGYWLGRTRHTKPGLMLAAASAGRLAGSPEEMVDEATKLLQASPEFAALDESVRSQLLDAVRVAALTAGTARIGKDHLVAGSGEAVQTAQEIVEDTTTDMAGDIAADDTVGHVIDGTETTAKDVGKGGVLGVVGVLSHRRRARRPRGPAADTSERDDEADTGDYVDTDNNTTTAPADGPSTADNDNAAAPPTAEVRAWARAHGIPVSDRGRLRAEVWEAYTSDHPER
jgi:hypothetical protein